MSESPGRAHPPEGLGDVGIGAALEPFNYRALVVARRQHQDGHLCHGSRAVSREDGPAEQLWLREGGSAVSHRLAGRGNPFGKKRRGWLSLLHDCQAGL
jgi:hypothetical protein